MVVYIDIYKDRQIDKLKNVNYNLLKDGCVQKYKERWIDKLKNVNYNLPNL